MNVLKKENWWIWLLVFLFSNGGSIFILGALLDIYDKDAWYAHWKYWLIGAVLAFLPLIFMIVIFTMEVLCKVCAKLDVPYKEYYLSPYVWILLFIIPIIGWIMFIVFFLYLEIMVFVKLYQGNAEKYIA